MRQIQLKRQITTLNRGTFLTAFIFALCPVAGIAQTRQQVTCVSPADCAQRAEQQRRLAAELRQKRLATEARYRQVQQEMERRSRQPSKEECYDTPRGRVCSRSSPMIVDERPQLRDEINRLAQQEQNANNLANTFDAQGRDRSQAFPGPSPAPTSLTDRSQAFPGPSPPPPPPMGCFIATAAYGSPTADDVVELRQFRDSYLLYTNAGRLFVAYYYRYSPPLADYIATHEYARLLTRAALQPVVFAVRHPYEAALVCALGVMLLFVATRWKSSGIRR